MSSNNLIHLTDKNFKEETAKGLVLVDFHAIWCGPCRTIAPVVEQLATVVAGKAKVGKLDIEEAHDTSVELQITLVPTLILFKDGKEVKRIQGVKDLDYLQKLVESYL
jgi:thioredoxin 1